MCVIIDGLMSLLKDKINKYIIIFSFKIFMYLLVIIAYVCFENYNYSIILIV